VPFLGPGSVVTDTPEIHYARSADGTKIAYQVTGKGPRDLVILGGGAIPFDLLWDDSDFIRFSRRLSTFSRTIWFDLRGWGASEGSARDGLIGEVFDADMRAVLDGIACDRVALFGWGYSSANALHFSVTHPERLDALVLFNSYAHYVREEDYPYGLAAEDVDGFMERFKEGWGTGGTLELLAPGRVADDRFRSWWIRSARLQLDSDQVVQVLRVTMESDLRPILSAIIVPTLVLHREENKYIEVGAGRYLAEHIPGAKFVVLPGGDHHYFVGDLDGLADEIEDFLTGARSGAEGEVVMAAVLFTDIVASTQHQARVGPREWSRLADHHDAMVRAALAHYRGHEVKTTGDGFLATFDATGRALRCAAEVVAGAKDIGLDLRAGVHSGEVELRGDDLGGLAVTIAKRVCDLAEPGQVLVSETVRGHMVGAGIEFDDRGEHELKGVPGTWRLYTVTG
jgi:class 3 adenylate cyclase/pimeloyl-ACP methyl ester carboxylesterase